MTREEEVARLAEIEARPTAGASDKIKKGMRAHFERRWMLQDAGDNIYDMADAWTERIMKGIKK